jgi:hypothetical protein
MPSRHRFLEPIHNVKDEARKPLPRLPADPVSSFLEKVALRDPHARHAPGMAAREDGGASRDRTDDLKLAKLALSQLSYGPIG